MAIEAVPGSTFLANEDVREDAPVRLFCFPGHASDIEEFAGWSAALPADLVECYLVRRTAAGGGVPLLPQPPAGSAANGDVAAGARHVLDSLVNEVLLHMDKPFIFFGRSIGAHLACALALELESRGLPQPKRLLVAGVEPLLIRDADGNDVAVPTAWLASGTEASQRLAADARLLAGLRKLIAPAAVAPPVAPALTCPLMVLMAAGSGVHVDVADTGGGGPAGGGSGGGWAAATSGVVTLVEVQVGEAVVEAAGTGRKDAALLRCLEEVVREDVRLSCAESTALIERWNSGTFDYPDKDCLHHLFVRSAAIFPQETAVFFQGKTLTFAELDALTDSLAAWLYEAGVRVGTSVGIFMEHCPEYVVAYIAAHKAGGAYMPIETVYPQELLRRVCEDARPVVVLTKAAFAARLPAFQPKLLMDDVEIAGSGGGGWRAAATAAPPLPADRVLPTPDDLAYVVMSSGTTGAPKGICCPHRGAVHSYYYRLVAFPYEPGEREACHVFFVWELLRPLLAGLPAAGGTPVPLYVIPDDAIYNPDKLVAYLRDHEITRVLFTPSLLQLVMDTVPAATARRALAKLRIVWLCGEVVTAELRHRFVDLLPSCRLENLYSISECHDISYANLNELNTRESPKYAPCGKVIPNVRAYILDDNLRPVPVGVPGRMYVAGPCLALGYLNMPEKTAERFVPCPFGAGGKMYDTGDRCRYLPSGSIEVLGRCDFMVKIRGYSVVVGAVEAAVAEHPLVSTACVLTEGAEGTMEKRLVAYVVPERWEAVPTVQSVQAFLKSRLPPYAVPSHFILLDAIPINMASGKLDRRKLPASASAKARKMPTSADFGDRAVAPFVPGGPADPAIEVRSPKANGNGAQNGNGVTAAAPSGPPATATERILAKLWGVLLKVEAATIQRGDDFFDLGGHSLMLVRLAAAVAAEPSLAGVELPVPDVLLRPTLAELAAHIDALAAAAAMAAAAADPTADPATAAAATAAAAAAAAATAAAAGADSVDLAAEAERLDPSIFPAPTRKTGYARFRAGAAAAPPRRVLLTGATGFLGSHVLAALLEDSSVIEVYCLVRASDTAAAGARLETVLRCYGLWDETAATAVTVGRIVPVAGDLAKPLLGLKQDEFKALACELDAIVHSGAEVNLVRSYHSLKAANVLGTQEVLRLAVTNGFSTRVKPVHYVSTNGVFPLNGSTSKVPNGSINGQHGLPEGQNGSGNGHSGPAGGGGECFGNGAAAQSSSAPIQWPEDADLSELWRGLPDGYAQSKWVAERFCLEARARGLPVSVLRAGNLAPSSSTGCWNPADFYHLLLAGCVAVGAAPNCPGWRVDMTPVDFAARAIVAVAVAAPAEALGRVLHVQNPRPPVAFSDVVDWIAAAKSIKLPAVPLAEFRSLVVAAAATAREDGNGGESGMLARLAAGLDGFAPYMADMGTMDAANMQAALEGTGISCPTVDAVLLAKYSQKLGARPSAATVENSMAADLREPPRH